MSEWERVLNLDQLKEGSVRTVKPRGGQVALFRVGEQVYALDNRCPHEGYPLATGLIKDGTVTCQWHNWKFRLCDGVCLLGGEDVRHYPTRVEDESIWIDLASQPAQVAIPKLEQSLSTAVDDEDWAQASRIVERLLAAGRSHRQILGYVSAWAASRARYGFDHGLATAADLAASFGDFSAEERDLPLMQAVTLMAEPNIRRPARLFPDAEVPHAGMDVDAELRQRIEDEDLEGSEALLRGALDQGASPQQIFGWLTNAATDHFLDFGHGHIYCVKAEELLASIGWEYAHPVLTSLVSRLVYGTREDLLPYMRSYRRLVRQYEPKLNDWAAATADPSAQIDEVEFLSCITDGELADALGAVATALDKRAEPARVAGLLGIAAAERMLRFESSYELDDTISEGWLDVTHLLTHADAVRESLVRRPASGPSLRGLFYSARFIQHTKILDSGSRAEVCASGGDGIDIIDAILRNDSSAAMAAASGIEPGRLRRFVVGDVLAVPIFVCHQIKLPFAALRVAAATDSPLPVMAAIRFLSSRLQQRRVLRRTKIARDFVRDGTMQKKLLGY